MSDLRILTITTGDDLPAGISRNGEDPRLPFLDPPWFMRARLGDQLLAYRFDVIVLSARTWAAVNDDEAAREWYDQEVVCRLQPGGAIIWNWLDGS